MSEQDGILSSALPIFSIMIDMCMFYYFDDHFEKKDIIIIINIAIMLFHL